MEGLRHSILVKNHLELAGRERIALTGAEVEGVVPLTHAVHTLREMGVC